MKCHEAWQTSLVSGRSLDHIAPMGGARYIAEMRAASRGMTGGNLSEERRASGVKRDFVHFSPCPLKCSSMYAKDPHRSRTVTTYDVEADSSASPTMA